MTAISLDSGRDNRPMASSKGYRSPSAPVDDPTEIVTIVSTRMLPTVVVIVRRVLKAGSNNRCVKSPNQCRSLLEGELLSNPTSTCVSVDVEQYRPTAAVDGVWERTAGRDDFQIYRRMMSDVRCLHCCISHDA